jgi:hypothetical protein
VLCNCRLVQEGVKDIDGVPLVTMIHLGLCILNKSKLSSNTSCILLQQAALPAGNGAQRNCQSEFDAVVMHLTRSDQIEHAAQRCTELGYQGH